MESDSYDFNKWRNSWNLVSFLQGSFGFSIFEYYTFFEN